MVEGGADIDRQYLNAGVIVYNRLDVAPILLGAGSHLFTGVRPEAAAGPDTGDQQPACHAPSYQVDASAVRS